MSLHVHLITQEEPQEGLRGRHGGTEGTCQQRPLLRRVSQLSLRQDLPSQAHPLAWVTQPTFTDWARRAAFNVSSAPSCPICMRAAGLELVRAWIRWRNLNRPRPFRYLQATATGAILAHTECLTAGTFQVEDHTCTSDWQPVTSVEV